LPSKDISLEETQILIWEAFWYIRLFFVPKKKKIEIKNKTCKVIISKGKSPRI
jgi:hypothetical protein